MRQKELAFGFSAILYNKRCKERKRDNRKFRLHASREIYYCNNTFFVIILSLGNKGEREE